MSNDDTDTVEKDEMDSLVETIDAEPIMQVEVVIGADGSISNQFLWDGDEVSPVDFSAMSREVEDFAAVVENHVAEMQARSAGDGEQPPLGEGAFR